MKKIILIVISFFALGAQAQHVTNNGITVTNSAVIYTNGGWQNSGSIKNNGSIITTDDWVNIGTLDPTSTGGFVLQYASAKTFTPSGNNFGFLVKQGAGNATINGSFAVNDSLSIKGGVLQASAPTDVLTVNAAGKVTVSPGSFLSGAMVRKGTGNLFFPVGKNTIYLPITFLNVSGTNQSLSVTIEDAPTGFTAGAGVNALINFPYVWRAVKTNAADTASFVEIEYPNTLPTATDLVVMRKLRGQSRYEGMGARVISNTGGVVKVRSYSRGLQGVFSIGRGFKGNLKTDSLALAAFFQSTGGSNWTNKSNWLTGRVNLWQGITETGGQITAVNLPANRITGAIPGVFTDIAALQTVNFSGNAITSLPDLTGATGLTSLNVSANRLGFSSLIPNVSIPGINYSNQGSIDANFQALPDVGTDYKVKAITDGTGNKFVWKRNGAVVAGAIDSTYLIKAINRSNMGNYVAEITNPAVPNLILKTGIKNIFATATLSGKMTLDGTAPVAKGDIYLLKVTKTGGYDTTATKAVATDGTFVFAKTILDDYILQGKPDVVLSPDRLLIYFKDKLFWEEADTLKIQNNLTGLDLVLQKKPAAPTGKGSISGFFEEERAGGRVEAILARGRVAGATVTARRVESAGRAEAEKLTLVATATTDKDGNFEMPNLPPANYRLNIQYPGYPMDPASFINFTIGTQPSSTNVSVSALVSGNKIVVSLVRITSVDDELGLTAYPNPVSEIIYVEFDRSGLDVQDVILTDLNGQVVKVDKQSTERGYEVYVNSVPKGIYVLSLVGNKNIRIRSSKIAIK